MDLSVRCTHPIQQQGGVSLPSIARSLASHDHAAFHPDLGRLHHTANNTMLYTLVGQC
jgi:hypothetical protein